MYGTPQDVISLTGIKPEDLGLESNQDPDKALYDLLTQWMSRIATHINVRLGENQNVRQNDSRYNGLIDVNVRTTAKMVIHAQQMRTNQLVQVGDFNIQTIDSTDVVRGLDTELKPFIRKSSRRNRLQIFSSIPDTNS